MRKDMHDHKKSSCPNRAEICTNEGCDTMIREPMIAVHKSLCPHEMVDCPFSSVGCSVVRKRNRIKRHEEYHVTNHSRLLLEMTEGLQERNEPLEVEELKQDNGIMRERLQQHVQSSKRDNDISNWRFYALERAMERNSKELDTTNKGALLGGAAVVLANCVWCYFRK